MSNKKGVPEAIMMLELERDLSLSTLFVYYQHRKMKNN